MGRVIALANQKGGVAKTTSTVNLAAALTERGERVLVVDLDPQSNLTMSQGFDPERLERTIFDVLVHKVPIEEIVQRSEFDVAVASIDLAGAELALSVDDRPRARAREGADARARAVRPHPDRHAAVARADHDQRPDRRRTA